MFNGPPPSLLSSKASRSAGLFQRKISPTATTILLWPDQPLQYYEFNNIDSNRSSISISSCTWQEHKKIQVSLRRGLYIVRRPINLITRNAYSYASTPVTIIPTLMKRRDVYRVSLNKGKHFCAMSIEQCHQAYINQNLPVKELRKHVFK